MRHGGEQLRIPPNSYLCLEHVDLLDCAGVCLPDDRDDVDLLVDLLHHLHVQGLQSVSGRGDEIEAGVHSEGKFY